RKVMKRDLRPIDHPSLIAAEKRTDRVDEGELHETSTLAASVRRRQRAVQGAASTMKTRRDSIRSPLISPRPSERPVPSPPMNRSALPPFLALLAPAAFGSVPLVTAGKAAAVVVTADHPGPVAKYAAEEFVLHVEKATGTRLQIATESAATDKSLNRVLIGDTAAARTAGIDVTKLAPETFVIRTADHALIIAGEDKNGAPLEADTRAGTWW